MPLDEMFANPFPCPVCGRDAFESFCGRLQDGRFCCYTCLNHEQTTIDQKACPDVDCTICKQAKF